MNACLKPILLFFQLCDRPFGGTAFRISLNQFAPSIARDVFLLHPVLALRHAEHGFGCFGAAAEAGNQAVASVDGRFAVTQPHMALHE